MKKKKLKRKILILEAELSALRHDLGVLVNEPNGAEAGHIRARVFVRGRMEDVMRKTEDAIWYGSPTVARDAFGKPTTTAFPGL